MSETLEQTVPTDAAGSRLDKWLIQQEAITISRSMLQSLMEQGAVLVNDQPVAKNYKVKAQDKVAVHSGASFLILGTGKYSIGHCL